MTDSQRLADPRDAAAALPRNSAVIVRHYEDRDRAGLTRALMTICRKKRNLVLLAGDVRLAQVLGVDGLHLPEQMLAGNANKWRLWRRPATLLSVSAHSPKALSNAARVKADFALLSPVFPTKSHPESAGIGVLRFTSWTVMAQLPVFALGGANAGNSKRLLACGAAGWAGIDGLR